MNDEWLAWERDRLLGMSEETPDQAPDITLPAVDKAAMLLHQATGARIPEARAFVESLLPALAEQDKYERLMAQRVNPLSANENGTATPCPVLLSAEQPEQEPVAPADPPATSP